MLDPSTPCQHCGSGFRNAQSLILQAIWCLEDACETHQNLMNRGITSTLDRQALEIDTISIGHGIRHALKGLFELHDLLYRRQPYGEDDTLPPYSLTQASALPSIRALTSLRLPIIGNPGPLVRRLKIRPRASYLQLHLNTNIDTSKLFGGDFGGSRQRKTKRRKGPKMSNTGLQLRNQSSEALQQGSAPSTAIEKCQDQQETVSKCENLQPYVSLAEKFNLIEALKTIRQCLERRWEFQSGIFSEAIVQCLEACENRLFLSRDQTIDSIWNVEHHEHRVEVFVDSDVGVWYRQKCICVKDALHALDVYCPRNMPIEASDEDDELEWDEELQEMRKKKTKKPTSPAESDSESDEDEEDEEDAEAERIAKEKELADTRLKIMAEICEMVGLDNVKEHMHKIAARVETSTRQGIDLKEERWGTVLIGNSGTGKTTFARNYAKYLSASGVVGSGFTETSGVYLSDGGITRTKSYITDLSYSGGVLFVDDAHRLLSYSGGRKVMDYMMQEIEKQRGKVVFVLAGHEKGMFKVLGHGNGTTALLPNVLNLKDYSDAQLLDLMKSYVKKKFDGKMKVEGGLDGLYMRVAARRIARDRDTQQFGNARAVENMLTRIWDRQSARLTKVRKEKEALLAAEEKTAEEKATEERATEERATEERATEERATEERVAEEKATEEKVAHRMAADGSMAEQKTTEGAKAEAATDQQVARVEAVKELDAKPKPESEDVEPNAVPSEKTEVKVENKFKDDNEETIESDPKSDSFQEGDEDFDVKNKKEQEEEKEEEEDKVDPADYLFTKEDILGPDPSEAILDSPTWQKIQKLAGLEAVKRSIPNLFEVVKSNYQRELEEKPLLKLSLNRLFLGPPGTGKTVVAKLYAQILVEIGALSKGEVIIKNPSDLIGQYIGDSEANTKAALTAAMGNVLVIDEAHMMYTGSSDGTGNESDCYRQAMIDTIVAEVQSVPGEDRAVLLLGYGDKMQEMLQNTNPGLSRRFPIADAFWFENFSLPELESILHSKMEEHVLEATPEAVKVAMDVLDKARNRMNFGNGGEVENLISKAKTNHQGRISLLPSSDRPEKLIFEPQDFDPEYDRGKSATLNLQKLFSDVIGCEEIVRKLESYQRVSQTMKSRNLDPKAYIPTNFIFKGPPGTGKTTTARKVAQVYYDMGFLSEASVVECSASDLVGKYIGHTGPKTTKVLEKALGKALFIDEAYRLASGGDNSFTTEVVSELVDLLTKPRFHGNLIVILAGYENEMNHLLSINPGLASRFPNEIHFTTLSSTHCLKMLKMKLSQAGIETPVLGQQKTMEYKSLVRLMGLLAGTPLWGNARDIKTLAKSLTMTVFGSTMGEGELTCSSQMVTGAMETMLQERRARGNVQSQNGLYI